LIGSVLKIKPNRSPALVSSDRWPYSIFYCRQYLRDIEVTLGANSSKYYAMGLRQSVRRTTLADANETFAQNVGLIKR